MEHDPDCYRTDDCSHDAYCDHCNSNYNSSDLSSAGNNHNDKSNDDNDDRDNFNNGDIRAGIHIAHSDRLRDEKPDSRQVARYQ